MEDRSVRISKHLSYSSLGEISPQAVYKIQVSDWIIKPSKYLSALYPDETDHGMALLAIQLMFFEAHGQFLTGQDSFNRSREIFSFAFGEFVSFMKSRGKIDSPKEVNVPELFYKFARCGLFHSSIMGAEMLVATIRIKEKVFYKNPHIDGWLVDPWLMISELEEYLDYYLAKLSNDKILLGNFNKTYQRFFQKHLSQFEGELPDKSI